MSNLAIWNVVAYPPKDVLKKIQGGRLNGMTDIKPQWRYRALTQQFGPCGIGWRYTIEKLWSEPGSDEQVAVFASIKLYVKHEGEWSEPIPGVGGSMAIAKERQGLHSSDECYKMAITDALSTACKMLGVGAAIYMGYWNGSKYTDRKPEHPPRNHTGGAYTAPADTARSAPQPSYNEQTIVSIEAATTCKELTGIYKTVEREYYGTADLAPMRQRVRDRMGVLTLDTIGSASGDMLDAVGQHVANWDFSTQQRVELQEAILNRRKAMKE